MKALRIILAILAFICAILCFWNPFGGFYIIGFIVAAVIGISCITALIANLATSDGRSAGYIVASIIGLLLSIVLFVLLIINPVQFETVLSIIIVAIVLIYAIIEGIMIIIAGFTTGSGAGKLVLSIICGLLLLGCAGVLLYYILATTAVAEFILGIVLGVSFIALGVKQIAACID